MATAICAKSGIEFTIQHFPYNFTKHGVVLTHPIFNLDYAQLTSEELLTRWVDRQMSEVDTKLYFLALLDSSGLIQWHCAASPSIATCESNMQPLLDILDWMYGIKHPRLAMSVMAVSEDTRLLPNIDQWIKVWQENKSDFENGYKSLTRAQLMMRKEDTLERLIKSRQAELSSYAGMLADWAALAAEFPETIRDYEGNKVSASVYWKVLITTCAKSENHIWRLHIEDLEDLLTYLEDNMDAGSIYGYAVLSLVRKGIATHKAYLGFEMLGRMDTSTGVTSSGLVSNAAEYALSKILAADAPATVPLRANYPNQIAYLRDKIRYEQSIKLLSSGGN